jgi:hypothetical protein
MQFSIFFLFLEIQTTANSDTNTSSYYKTKGSFLIKRKILYRKLFPFSKLDK